MPETNKLTCYHESGGLLYIQVHFIPAHSRNKGFRAGADILMYTDIAFVIKNTDI